MRCKLYYLNFGVFYQVGILKLHINEKTKIFYPFPKRCFWKHLLITYLGDLCSTIDKICLKLLQKYKTFLPKLAVVSHMSWNTCLTISKSCLFYIEVLSQKVSLVRWSKFPKLDPLAILHLELASTSKEILNQEYAVLLSSNKIVIMIIPNNAIANTIHYWEYSLLVALCQPDH